MFIQVKGFMKKLINKYSKLINELLSISSMHNGKYRHIETKCGTVTCKCYSGELHKHKRLTWSEGGKPHNRAIPDDDVAWIEDMIANHQRFKSLGNELNKMEKIIHEHLKAHKIKAINKAKRAKHYLVVN